MWRVFSKYLPFRYFLLFFSLKVFFLNNEMNNNEFENEEVIVETAVAIEEDAKPKMDWKKELWDWVKAIAIAFVVAYLLKSFVLTLAKVQGPSMEPTLQNADRLYVNKLFYTPEKGDVVIVESEDTNERFWIKRVIATEGDTLYIDFSSGDVYVNDEIIDEPYIKEKTALVGTYISNLMSSGNYSRENPIVLGKDEVFVMGDNRNNSRDSRFEGPFKEEDVVGHAVFRFWPLNTMGCTDHDFEEK